MKEYEVQPTHVFNMDEKGFQIGTLGRSKRVFDKVLYDQKGVRAALQDGNTTWITVLACVCADGTALSPALIFQSACGALQSSWADAIEAGKHSVFLSSSPTGWTNNDIGLAWIKEVFDRETRRQARSGYRLLLLDGHGSHITMDFINFCNDNKILLAVFPPHATHTLQPLDVSLFKPLSDAYSIELANYLQDSQGLLPIQKGDFFPLFWTAWGKAFKPQTIKRSFEATGIYPPNADVILQKYNNEAYNSDKSSSSCFSGDDWLKLESIIRRTVKDQSNKEVKKLRRSLHHISAQASLLKGEVRGLRAAMGIKKRREKKSYTLQLNKPQEYHGGAVFWSPRRVRQARDDEAARQQQQQLKKIQKAERAQLKEQSRLYKLQVAEEKRVERERLEEVREKERAAEKAEKERQKAARDAQKAIQLSQSGKRKASQAHKPPKKRQKGGGNGARRVQAEVAAPIVPTQTTRQGRTTKVPSKYK
ncbi:Pogo transposable element [Pyrenophora tritici-repentis]|nr:Pogo transposable element [Pyrenophora tritici-repentis]